MAADALAPYVCRSSRVPVFHKEGFTQYSPSQFGEMIANKTHFMFLKINSVANELNIQEMLPTKGL